MNTASQHNYGTRIRQNQTHQSATRAGPSNSPAALAPCQYPQYPSPHVVLHQDDLNSKTFLAIARSFSSVQNKAMTIKDLADMIQKHGLLCHSVSAANQAITTYIRNHLQRCEAQQDTPLLIPYILSGTFTDDDLIPALYSHSGGAHATVKGRLTNFRKGTAVWYLSRVTGAPCPFARANIRLSDYTDDSRVPEPLAVKEPQSKEQIGQKRKRPKRSCASKSHSDSDSPPPAKSVKLTLRIKPLIKNRAVSPSAAVDSDSDSLDELTDEECPGQAVNEPAAWCLPPYPRRSTISIPGYRPPSESAELLALEPLYTQHPAPRHRSPVSPPPDSDYYGSDYDDDELPLTMTGARRSSSNFDDRDDDISEPETHWDESPGPRSPSAPPTNDILVSIKQEVLDPNFSSWSPYPQIDFMGNTKIESLEQWSWDAPHVPPFPDWVSEDPSSDFIKQEYEEVSLPFSPISVSPETARLPESFAVRQQAYTEPVMSFIQPFEQDDTAPTLSSLVESMSINSPTATTPAYSWSASPAAFHFASPAEKMAQTDHEIRASNVSPLAVIQIVNEAENTPQEWFHRLHSSHDSVSNSAEPPPLSATEQEMFLAFCADSDYPHCPTTPVVSQSEASSKDGKKDSDQVHERPLRRSKRVAMHANAIPTVKTPVRTPRRAATRKIAS